MEVPREQWQEVLIKASLIEREAPGSVWPIRVQGGEEVDVLAVVSADREVLQMMARAIENRLAQGMSLGIDATVLYGLGRTSGDLTDAELADPDNPYNTRVHTGLPPGPIASPGEASIEAVLNPADGDWIFWCTVDLETGETKFAVTYTEHQQNVAELAAWLEEQDR
jgi:UPF0755 protein